MAPYGVQSNQRSKIRRFMWSNFALPIFFLKTQLAAFRWRGRARRPNNVWPVSCRFYLVSGYRRENIDGKPEFGVGDLAFVCNILRVIITKKGFGISTGNNQVLHLASATFSSLINRPDNTLTRDVITDNVTRVLGLGYS